MKPFKQWIERLVRGTSHRASASGRRKTAGNLQSRPGVYFIPRVWRGPATPVPEHIRQHGIRLDALGIAESPAANAPDDASMPEEVTSPPNDALRPAVERIAALESRQAELEKLMRLASSEASSADPIYIDIG